MLSSGGGVNGFLMVSCIRTLPAICNPGYECAELLNLCLNDGMTALVLEPIALIGSPKYQILSGLVLLSSVNLLAISVEIFLPIPAPKPVNTPPSENPIAESADALMATPPATPKSKMPSLTIVLPSLPKLLPILPLTTGAPNVLD